MLLLVVTLDELEDLLVDIKFRLVLLLSLLLLRLLLLSLLVLLFQKVWIRLK